jgi:HEAT repeat protein
MGSVFDAFRKIGAGAFVLKAIVAAIAADVLLLGFILLRRTYRRRYFAKRDARMFQFRLSWDALISGQIAYETWRTKPSDRRIVESMALDALEAAGPQESARLLKFLRESGLIEKGIFDARLHKGWRRQRALVALGRTRAPEGIPALSEGLRDRNVETRLAALRGLGRMACSEAAEEILHWLEEVGLAVPALPLQGALVQCCGERPRVLLPYLQRSEGAVREVLGRVLGEVATPSLGTDMLQFVDDKLPELRAAAARALSHADATLALDVLGELAQDPVWFVRLRAVVSLGKLSRPGAIPLLLRGLTDSHRLVRLRAAEALVAFHGEIVPVFEEVVASADRYGLHAFVTALDNAGLQGRLERELRGMRGGDQGDFLLRVLRTVSLPPSSTASQGLASAHAASQS